MDPFPHGDVGVGLYGNTSKAKLNYFTFSKRKQDCLRGNTIGRSPRSCSAALALLSTAVTGPKAQKHPLFSTTYINILVMRSRFALLGLWLATATHSTPSNGADGRWPA